MTFDYKKEYKEYYMPPKTPTIVDMPPMNYIAVRGKGNPNDESGEYKAAIGLLYGIAFTLKMSYKGSYKIDGYFEYVVPPLEGLWWQTGSGKVDYRHKEDFEWISMIRLPDFIKEKDFEWAKSEATKKKKIDFSKVEFFSYQEGKCVQCMHVGSYDNEPATIAQMENYAKSIGYNMDRSIGRRHHEIYLSDPRKGNPDKLKTIIRLPIIAKEKIII